MNPKTKEIWAEIAPGSPSVDQVAAAFQQTASEIQIGTLGALPLARLVAFSKAASDFGSVFNGYERSNTSNVGHTTFQVAPRAECPAGSLSVGSTTCLPAYPDLLYGARALFAVLLERNRLAPLLAGNLPLATETLQLLLMPIEDPLFSVEQRRDCWAYDKEKLGYLGGWAYSQISNEKPAAPVWSDSGMEPNWDAYPSSSAERGDLPQGGAEPRRESWVIDAGYGPLSPEFLVGAMLLVGAAWGGAHLLGVAPYQRRLQSTLAPLRVHAWGSEHLAPCPRRPTCPSANCARAPLQRSLATTRPAPLI